MKDLENGYVYADGIGNVHFMSYESLGSGAFMAILLVVLTIFIKDANSFLINNKWVIIIPTFIAVFIRTLIFDKSVHLYRRIINILGDSVKTICMYCVLIALIDKAANAHWLDRAFFALFYGALFFGVNWLTEWILKFLRTTNLSIVHLIVCVIISIGALFIYFNHSWYWQGYDYKVFFNRASIVKIDERMEGTITLPDKIHGYIVESIGKDAFGNNKKVTYIELPNTVKTIGKDAFGLADNLQGVKIPKSVEKIESSLFSFNYHFEIYYEGTQDDWNKIDIQDNNIKALSIHFNAPKNG